MTEGQGYSKQELIADWISKTANQCGAYMKDGAAIDIAEGLLKHNSPDIKHSLDSIALTKRDRGAPITLREIIDNLPDAYPTAERAFQSVVDSAYWEEWGSRSGLYKAALASFNLAIYQKAPKSALDHFKQVYDDNLHKYGHAISDDTPAIEDHSGQEKNTGQYVDEDEVLWKINYARSYIQQRTPGHKSFNPDNEAADKQRREMIPILNHYRAKLAKIQGRPAPEPMAVPPLTYGDEDPTPEHMLTPEDKIRITIEQAKGIPSRDTPVTRAVKSCAKAIMEKQCARISERDQRDYDEVYQEFVPKEWQRPQQAI